MYTLARLVEVRGLMFEQAPVVFIAFVIAELFYKFHSFTLECIAFLATWYVLDGARQRVQDWFTERRGR